MNNLFWFKIKALQYDAEGPDIGKYDGSLDSDVYEHVSPQDAPDLALDSSALSNSPAAVAFTLFFDWTTIGKRKI
ncbi:hypothetical protein LENED_001639 [Lentinula edodes]|uniref:Uncharacterized protein n=1 Tax=Lentinula edodes TaxID=5353 RepID=A0A1Q3DYX5_LENED|nr:hypothetical protein LENED_001639 [Lentinula edodes]